MAIYQFAPGLGHQAKVRDAGGSIVVTDLPMLTTPDNIMIQCEGLPGPYDDPDKLEKDHYDIFLDLIKNGDSPWDVDPTVENPITSNYWKLDRRTYFSSR
jgi:hypothetical protein